MTDREDRTPVLVSTRVFRRVEIIDGGDTLVFHLVTADFAETAILVPRSSAQELYAALGSALEEQSKS